MGSDAWDVSRCHLAVGVSAPSPGPSTAPGAPSPLFHPVQTVSTESGLLERDKPDHLSIARCFCPACLRSSLEKRALLPCQSGIAQLAFATSIYRY